MKRKVIATKMSSIYNYPHAKKFYFVYVEERSLFAKLQKEVGIWEKVTGNSINVQLNSSFQNARGI